MKENEKNGNTVGNSSNKGKMAESDGWVYYAVNGNEKYRRHLSYERSISDFGTCSGRCKCFLHKYKTRFYILFIRMKIRMRDYLL